MKYVVPKISEYIDMWLVLNEPNGGFSQEILRKYLNEMPRVRYDLPEKHHLLDNVNNNTVFMGGI